MTNGIPLEIEHLKARLLRDFRDLLPHATKGDAAERETNLLTRALAAFVLAHEAGADPATAADCVVDGGGDGGIDALLHNSIAARLWIVQSKFIRNGQGEPSLADVSKFKDGVQALVEGRFDHFDYNEVIRERVPELEQPSRRVRSKSLPCWCIREVQWSATIVCAFLRHLRTNSNGTRMTIILSLSALT